MIAPVNGGEVSSFDEILEELEALDANDRALVLGYANRIKEVVEGGDAHGLLALALVGSYIESQIDGLEMRFPE